ncbi:aldo/keto reductase [Sandaracinobacteroides saxicola]|uniref:Aldo/keto reductase n=1 Tax=Sandaracinobacteroides saxicola TaxID=2759707 RepID=A0A7G5IM48_9SPHN|nr:aldo/keto reductase [Sandaracinobacteroides saxicola]QMW24440.1 aldo/keto reductase [Sandaracinobacteroides saxicola]
MERRPLGRSGIWVSALSFGASALGGVFHAVDEDEAIRAVHAALDAGISYFDVAPAYGGTRAETLLGKALKGVPRERYILSTKVGKYSGADGRDRLDFTEARIRAEFEASLARLGVEHVDILHIHDIEYEGRDRLENALGEGVATVQALKREGRTRAVGFGFYPVDLWERVLREVDCDAALVHNHYGLHDTRLEMLLPHAAAKGVGVISASPFASGMLTECGAPAWHPASAADRAVAAEAATLCRARGSSIEKLAFQFAASNGEVATMMFSSANAASVLRNIGWLAEPLDMDLVSDVRAVLGPLIDRDWY